MKNKRIYISMLVLAIVFLVGMYILKIFFPQEFMLAIQNEKIVIVGEFISSHLWLRYICYVITSFFTYWLFCCACCHRLKLTCKECLYILIAIICIALVELFDFNISTHLSIASFLVLPALMGGDIKTTSVVYLIHGIAQCLMLGIRNLPMYLVSANYLTIFFVGIETYLWLILFYIIFNYKKENK